MCTHQFVATVSVCSHQFVTAVPSLFLSEFVTGPRLVPASSWPETPSLSPPVRGRRPLVYPHQFVVGDP